MTDAVAMLKEVVDWASKRCPCHNDVPNPCPLCGASVENLEACKAVESIFPRELLMKIRDVIARSKQPEFDDSYRPAGTAIEGKAS